MPTALRGVNANHIARHIPKRTFQDSFKECDTWFAPSVPGSPTAVDSNGFPTADWPVQTRLWTNAQGHYLAGTYTVTFAGTGQIDITGDATATINTTGGTFTVTTPSDTGILFVITSSSASPNHVRNIKVVHSSFLATFSTQPIDPTYAAWMGSAGSIIRFMDPAGTNDSLQELWANRPTVTYFTQNSASSAQATGLARGMAVQHMIQLCNLANCSAWWCVPHMADDDYVTQAATLFAAGLNPGLKLYIEYSNEIWNGQFSGQFDYCKDQGALLGLGSNDTQNRHRFQKVRSIEIFDLVAAVFGGTERLVRILAGQLTVPSVLEEAMNFHTSDNGKVDSLSVTTYFMGTVGSPTGNPSGRKPTTLDHVFTDIALERPARLAVLDTAMASIAAYGKPMESYEGGGALITTGAWTADQTLQALFNTASRDSRMYDAYRLQLNDMAYRGIRTLMHYADIFAYTLTNSPARWGLAEYVGQDLGETPKLRAWLDNWAINGLGGGPSLASMGSAMDSGSIERAINEAFAFQPRVGRMRPGRS